MFKSEANRNILCDEFLFRVILAKTSGIAKTAKTPNIPAAALPLAAPTPAAAPPANTFPATFPAEPISFPHIHKAIMFGATSAAIFFIADNIKLT